MTLDSLMKGVLDILTPIISPDWGKLVTLIPALLALVVLAYLTVTAIKWINLANPPATSPDRKYKRFWEH